MKKLSGITQCSEYYLDCPYPVIIIMKNSKDMLRIKQILLAKAVKNCLFQNKDIWTNICE